MACSAAPWHAQQPPALPPHKYSGVASGVKWQHELRSSSKGDKTLGRIVGHQANRHGFQCDAAAALRVALQAPGAQPAGHPRWCTTLCIQTTWLTKLAAAVAVAHGIEPGRQLEQVVCRRARCRQPAREQGS